jgi:hypothetical protein
MAVLYSERVHALTLTDGDLAGNLLEHARQKGLTPSMAPRTTYKVRAGVPMPFLSGGVITASTIETIQYLEFIQAHRSEFEMLIGAGLFVSHFPQAFVYGGTFRADDNTARILQRWPASYWDFGRGLPLQDAQVVASFQGYLAFLAGMAQQQHAILGTWSLDFQHQLMMAVDELSQGGPIAAKPSWDKEDTRPRRQATEVALANSVLEQFLPAVDDLSFHDILELRNSCKSEIKGFQVSIQKLATTIELAGSPAEQASELRDRISADVEPAVRDLEAKLLSARWGLLKGLPTKLGLATVATMAVRFFASGVPSDIVTLLTAAVTTGAAAASAAVDVKLQRNELLREHQWSMVFRLTQLVRRKISEKERLANPFNVAP